MYVDNCPECRLAIESIRACRHYDLVDMIKSHLERMHICHEEHHHGEGRFH